jgi:CHAD domain-containing protein
MREYACQQTALLLDRLSAVLNRAARAGDADSIHDIRVAMRRLSRCLRVFAPFYADRSWKKIRRRIASLMAAAGAVRDCDIAIELVGRAGIARRNAIVMHLAAQRRKAGRELLLEIRRWKSHDYPHRWRARLMSRDRPLLSRDRKGAVPFRQPIAWNPRLSVTANARRHLPPMIHGYFTQVRELLATNPAPAELHPIRLATKRVRYTLELFRPCYGRGLELRLATLQRLQQLLGEINDCAAAERLIEGLVPASPVRRRAETFLRRRASAKATALRREWRDNFDAPGREHWWLRYLASSASVRQPRL